MQLTVIGGVDGDLKQRHEDVLQQLLEVGQLLLCVVHITVERDREHAGLVTFFFRFVLGFQVKLKIMTVQ